MFNNDNTNNNHHHNHHNNDDYDDNKTFFFYKHLSSHPRTDYRASDNSRYFKEDNDNTILIQKSHKTVFKQSICSTQYYLFVG